jgi:hypothetical protein
MADRPRRVIMYGSSGPNLRHWLEYLEPRAQDIQTTLICSRFEQNGEKRRDYPHLQIVELSRYRRNPIGLLWMLLSHSYDLFILQGIYQPKVSALLVFLLRARRKYVQMWNVSSHRRVAAEPGTLESRLLRWALRKSDGILFSWEPSRDDFVELFPSLAGKTAVFRWGINNKYFDLGYAPSHKLINGILDGVQPTDILILWPRAILPDHRQDLLVKALPIVQAQLSADLWRRVKIILIGRVAQSPFAKGLAESINELGMSNIRLYEVEPIEKDYLLRLYDKADIYIDFSNSNVQPSFGLFEAAARRTLLVLSDSEAHRHLLALGFEVTLVEGEPAAVAASLCRAIEDVDRDSNNMSIQRNLDLVRKLFNENERFQAIFRHCLGQS